MLQPSKHSHPDRTVIGVSVQLLARLKKRRLEDYSDLKKHIARVVTGGDVLFLPALNLLYLLGVIDYRPKTDAIEYVGPNEDI